jgi:outer membrane protein TolC
MNIPRPNRRKGRGHRAARIALALVTGAASGPGCTREFFRNWADQDVTEAVFEKTRDPRFRFDMFSIEPPAMSRFADPYDPDRPPAPPDDRAAEALSPVPQWSHHRLLSPAEGTGYLDLLELWRSERPAERPQNVAIDSGPSGTPADLVTPPPSDVPAPFQPFGNSGTDTPPLSPNPLGGESEIPPPDPRIPGELAPPDPRMPAAPDPNQTQPQARNRTTDQAVRTVAFQNPAVDDPRPDQTNPPALAPETIAGEASGADGVPAGESTDLIAMLKPQEMVFDEGLAAGLPPEVDPYVISPRQALTLALQNSRAYQFNLEDVYIAGLGTTLARFDFQPQFAAGMSAPNLGLASFGSNPPNTFQYRTNEAPGGYQSLLNIGTVAGFGKLLSSGMRVAGGFANQTILDFGGPAAVTTTSRSFLPLSVSQAFLRGGGRAVTLEPLTQAERALLYEVRDFTEFRRAFVVSVLAGGGVTGGSDPAIGFLQVLNLQQQVENNTKNVAAFQRVLEVFQQLGVGAGSSVNPLDIVNVEQTLQQQRAALVSSLNTYRNQLDSYKIQLGMPPDTPVIPDTSLLTGFRQVFDEIDGLVSKPRPTLEVLVDRLPGLQDVVINGRSVIGKMASAQETLRQRRPINNRISERQFIVGRIERLNELLQREGMTEGIGAEQVAVLRRQIEREQEALARLGSSDAADRAEIKRLQALEEQQFQQSNEQLEETMRAAERVAMENRLDLMNARAQLYDAWRQLAVTANALQGVFNLALSNQFLTPGTTTNPFGFNDQAKQFSLTMNAELPLVRLAERNNFVRARINYERQRRTLMQAEDQIKLTVRNDVRNLQLQYQNYEIQKQRYIASLVTQDQSFQKFLEPPRAGGGGSGTGGTLVLSLNSALAGVLSSQNTLVQNWVSYQTQRLNLYRDLAIMPYDEWEAFYELFPAASAGPDETAGRLPERPAAGAPAPAG